MSFTGNNPKFNTSTFTPQSADPTSPTEGMVFYADGTVRTEGLWQYKNGNWQFLGGGGGEVNFYENGDADSASLSDFTFGNNAVFDGGGTLQGVFSISTTAADIISGSSVFKLVLNATPGTSDDDYISTTVIDIPQGYRGRVLGVKLQYKYDGATGDVKWAVKDQVNTVILTTGSELLSQFDNTDNTAKEFTLQFFCPADATQIKIGPQVLTHATGSEVLLWDDVVVTPNPFVFKNLTTYKQIFLDTSNGFSTAGSTMRFTNVVESGPEAGLFTYTDITADGATLEFNSDCYVTGQLSRYPSNTSNFGISVNPSSLASSIVSITVDGVMSRSQTTASAPANAASTFRVSAGDKLYFHSDGVGAGIAGREFARVLAWKESENVLAYSQLEAIAGGRQILLDTQNGYGSAGSTMRYTNATQSGADTNLFTYIDDTTEGAEITFNKDCFVGVEISRYASASSNFGVSLNPSSRAISITSLTNAEVMCRTNGSGSLPRNAASIFKVSKGDKIYLHSDGVASGDASKEIARITAWRNPATNLVGVPVPQVAYIQDVKSTATDGGGFNSGAWQTRILTSVTGDTSIASLVSNQIILGPGTYDIHVSAPARAVGRHKARFQNITDATTAFDGSSENAATGAVAFTRSLIDDRLVITSTKTFEVQHQCQTTAGGNGFGQASNFGTAFEIYTMVRITKLK